MNYKKTSLSMAALITLAIMPVEAASDKLFKTGFVSGLSVGYSHMKTKNTKNTEIAPGGDGQAKNTASHDGIMGTFFGGYRYVMAGGFVVGCNLGFSMDNNKTKKNDLLNTINTRVKLNRQYQVTPSLVIGQTIGDKWMVFTELAASISRFKLSNKAVATTTEVNFSKTYTKVGFAPTVGVEYAMSRHLSVLGTVGYEVFGKKKQDLGDLIQDQPLTKNHVKVRPHYVTAKVGVMYKF